MDASNTNQANGAHPRDERSPAYAACPDKPKGGPPVDWETKLDWEEHDPQNGSLLQHMIAGSAAGVAEHVVMFPVDTYKAR